jgi:thiol-disulfide isomerase/thioredoxin
VNRRRILIVLAGLALFGVAASLLPQLLRTGHALEGEPAPDFTLPMLGHGDRERVRLSDQRGKVIVLDFWASWCEPCRHGIPLFNRAVEKFGDKLIVLGINSEQHDDNVLGILAKDWGFKYSTLRDPALEAQLAYQVQVFPTVVLIDPDGVVRRVYPGEPTESALFDQISKYLR